MEYTEEQAQEINLVTTKIEKMMMDINPDLTEGEKKSYIAGYLDSMQENGKISEFCRGEIYQIYCM